MAYINKWIAKFQSALPRGERHDRRAGDDRSKAISIRAPARGATVDEEADFPDMDISIRAPARGATGLLVILLQCADQFQSALPRGERRERSERSSRVMIISIRAPARGATTIFTKKFSSLLAKIV